MNINYELYKVFYEVVINGSISKASESMYISQPAVTQSIKNLEEKLGGKLLIRTKKGIVLTEEGKVLFDYVKKGVESFKNGENAFLNYLNLDSGSIRIGASTTITRNILMPYLEKFHKKYPKVDIKITNDLTSNLVTSLRNGDLDLLVVNLPMEENKDLKIIPICEVHDIFVGNKDYYNKLWYTYFEISITHYQCFINCINFLEGENIWKDKHCNLPCAFGSDARHNSSFETLCSGKRAWRNHMSERNRSSAYHTGSGYYPLPLFQSADWQFWILFPFRPV